MYFRNYGLQNMRLDKCLKSLVSKQSSTVNKLNGSKQCQNLHDINLFIIFNHSDRDWVRKCLLVVRETLGSFVNILTADD